MKTQARETDERSSKRMHSSSAHVLPSCYLFSLWLYFIYGWFQTHVIFILFSFLLSLYSFSHGFGTVSVKVFVQCLASLFHVILVYPSVWATIKHFRQNRTKSRSAPYVAFDRYCEADVTSDFRTTFFFPIFLGCQRMRVT